MTYILSLFPIIISVSSLFFLFSINEVGKKEIIKVIKKEGKMGVVSLSSGYFSGKNLMDSPRYLLSYNDLPLIKNSCPQIKTIALETWENVENLKMKKRVYPPDRCSYIVALILSGITPEYKEIMNLKMKKGRYINKVDMLYKRRVCVIGGKICDRLGEEKVLGEIISIKIRPDSNLKFTVVGILQKKMPLFASLPDEIVDKLLEDERIEVGREEKTEKDDKKSRKRKEIGSRVLGINDAIFIPFTTWQDISKGIDFSRISIGGIILERKESVYLSSSSSLPRGSSIIMKIDLPEKKSSLIIDEEGLKVSPKSVVFIDERLKEPITKIRKALKKKYGEDKYFFFSDCGTLADELELQTEKSNKLFCITALFSLLLSGIIISSMMLLSVHKRITEIGVRRAFGARKRDIFLQFIGEGIMLYSRGIIIGLLIGVFFSYLLITNIAGWEFSFPFYGIILSSLFPLLVGIISSLYPALRAANIPPAQAVKYE